MDDSMMYEVAAGAGSTAAVVASLVFYVLLVVALWKIFTKAGKAGWLSIIPLVNVFKLYEIATGSGWKMFLTLIPIFGEIYAAFILPWKLCKAYGKGVGFYIGLLLLYPIFILLLGFDKSTYVGPQ